MSEGTAEKEVFISLEDARRLAQSLMPSRYNGKDSMTEFERGIQYACGIMWGAFKDCRKIEVDPEQIQRTFLGGSD